MNLVQNCAIDLHTKIPVKISMEIRISADIQKGQISADNIGVPVYRTVSSLNCLIGPI